MLSSLYTEFPLDKNDSRTILVYEVSTLWPARKAADLCNGSALPILKGRGSVSGAGYPEGQNLMPMSQVFT